jgi:hypothetical protein
VAEVEAAFGITGVTDAGTGTYCEFNADGVSVIVLSQPGAFEVEPGDFPDGVELTVAGYPAVSSEAEGGVLAGVDGQLLVATYTGSEPWEAVSPLLVSLMELAIPRLSSGIDPADLARVEALIPATIAGLPVTIQSAPGDVLLGQLDATSPPVVALQAALEAQGLTTTDILFVAGQTDSPEGYGVTAVLIAGGDAAPLVEPLLTVFSGGTATGFEPATVGDKAVTLVDLGGVTVTAYAVDDVFLTIGAPDDEVERILADLP